jgi:hypothetical protein
MSAAKRFISQYVAGCVAIDVLNAKFRRAQEHGSKRLSAFVRQGTGREHGTFHHLLDLLCYLGNQRAAKDLVRSRQPATCPFLMTIHRLRFWYFLFAKWILKYCEVIRVPP